jgi:hypothetical protein
MQGCQRESIRREHNTPRSASPPSQPPVFPGLQSWRGIATCSELLRAQRERINSALAANDRVLERLAADRIILGLAFTYLAGILTPINHKPSS